VPQPNPSEIAPLLLPSGVSSAVPERQTESIAAARSSLSDTAGICETNRGSATSSKLDPNLASENLRRRYGDVQCIRMRQSADGNAACAGATYCTRANPIARGRNGGEAGDGDREVTRDAPPEPGHPICCLVSFEIEILLKPLPFPLKEIDHLIGGGGIQCEIMLGRNVAIDRSLGPRHGMSRLG
jgi:hypothetical protein